MKMSRKTTKKLAVGVAFVLVASSLLAHNVVPNPSFELETDVPDGNFVVNEGNTASWTGGILTAGDKKTFCEATILHGRYAMALHKDYPEISASFTVAVGGTYDLSFRHVSRRGNDASQRCGMTVKVKFDNDQTVVATACPTSWVQWTECRTTVSLAAGTHTIRLVGELNAGITDSSTIVDMISLDLLGRNIVPNHSFENGTIAKKEGSFNDPDAPVTHDWEGGYIGAGSDYFCAIDMVDGEYGLVLLRGNASSSCTIEADKTGKYSLSFKCIKSPNGGSKAVPVAAYFDDMAEACVVGTPSSKNAWAEVHSTVNLTQGSHTLRLVANTMADGAPTVIDFVSLVLMESDENFAPNPSFESGASCSDFAANDKAPYAVSEWKGGIVTAGGSGKTFCAATMADGTYGMALHKSYPETSASFHLDEGGRYTVRFQGICRKAYKDVCEGGMDVSLKFDSADRAVLVATPSSSSEWEWYQANVELAAGDHTMRFAGSLKEGVLDASAVIDNIVLSRDYSFGVSEKGEGLPDELQQVACRAREDVDENDVITLKGRRFFASDGTVFVATGAVASVDGVLRDFPGESIALMLGVTTSVTWRYAEGQKNLIPNCGFENGTSVGSNGFKVNGEHLATENWVGGIVTRGHTAFCSVDMYENAYGMALHREYPSASIAFATTSWGKYDFSFAYIARDDAESPFKGAVEVYVDDAATPIVRICPKSVTEWAECSTTIKIPAGNHTLSFVRDPSVTEDSSTVIDGIALRELPKKGLCIIVK